MDYKKAGVDIEKGDLFVEKITTRIRETYDARVISGVGGFAALYEIDSGRLLAAGTDGVGTKVKLAQALNTHGTIGQDLVAMCVNDVICTGARPMFFLDYLAVGELDLGVGEEIVGGIARACKEAGCALIGGETAEMPGVYAPGVYDLAGFAVGEVERKNWLDGSKINGTETLIGLRSSGFHSNGYSLVRKLLREGETELMREALTPTRLYVRLVQALLQNQRENIAGLAHITGGGIENIPRMNEAFTYRLDAWCPREELPIVMRELTIRASMSALDLHKTFNMGIGMVIAVKDAERALAFLKGAGEQALTLGAVVPFTGDSLSCSFV
jgi:phosphoribosylformylglycinamidine cyclo-ligase